MKLPIILFTGVLAFFLWCLYGDISVSVASYFTEQPALNLAGASAWGDSFGAFNALFSLIGAIAVVITLNLQQQSIRAQ